MKYTANMGLRKPDGGEYYSVEDFNSNVDILDAIVSGKVDKLENTVNGNLLSAGVNGCLADSGKKTVDFARAEHSHDAVYAPILHISDDAVHVSTDEKAVIAVVGSKADKSYVDSVIKNKADVSALTEAVNNLIAQLASKADNSTELIADRIYKGVDLAEKFAVEISRYSDVWAWIKTRIQTGNFIGLHVGDYIPFIAGGNVIKAEIAGIDTYHRCGDVAVGHHIDFISRDCWPDTHVFNKANYNNGTSVSPHPWLASDLYAWLNSLSMQVPNAATANPAMISVNYTVTGVYDKLPAALKTVIVNKRILLPLRYTVDALLMDDNNRAWADAGKLWLPSEVEVYGCEHWGSMNGNSGGSFQQYPLFANNMRRIKGAVDGGVRCHWWLLSAFGSSSSSFAYVYHYGYANGTSAQYADIRVPLCFRIA